MYQLKKGMQSFAVVEGPMAGHTFAPGKIYDKVPSGMEANFVSAANLADPNPAPAAGSFNDPAPATTKKKTSFDPPAETTEVK